MAEFTSSADELFPEALPGLPGVKAFGVEKTDLDRNIQVHLSHENGVWQHNACSLGDVTNDHVRSLIQDMHIELPMFGQTAQCNPLTLDAAAKQKANIPEDADRFCWANPVALTDDNKQRISRLNPAVLANPDVALLLYGGFMYFSGTNLIQCNSLVPSDEGLLFGTPKSFTSHLQKQLDLARDGRFQEITIEFYRSKGAQYFCWVLPGELDLCRNGGFIYLFGDMTQPHHQNCYFEVLGQEDFSLRSSQLQREPIEETPRTQFGLVGMTPEQLAQVQAFVSETREHLDQLLDQQQENGTAGLQMWSTMQCIQKLTEVGAKQAIIQAFRDRQLNGADLEFLWNTVESIKTSNNDQGGGQNLEDLNLQIQRLQAELESTQICCVCLSESRQTLLTPCNHIPACEQCSQSLDKCPICRSRIRGRRRVHV